MGSFGNYVGATMGTSTNENGQSGAVYDNSWVTNPNYSKRQALVGNDGKFVHVDDFSAPDTSGVYPDLKTTKLGDVPGLLYDQSTNQQVVKQLTGPKALNWESKSFNQLKAENTALNPTALDAQATAWTDHGTQLKSASETFKSKVRSAIAGKWSGESAAAAETATHQVTETSIYDFTPASDALKQRLALLSGAFNAIKQNFPPGNDLIDAGNFNADQLDAKIHDFNSKYHLDGSGHLRNNDDGYVTAADALKELDQIKRSITDYQKAVQLFRDTYNPTVATVTANFPQLPPPPDMTFGQQGPGQNNTGTGPYNTTGGGPPSAGGGGKPAISPTDFGKNKAIPDLGKDIGKALDTGDNKPIDPSQTDLPDTPTTSDPTQTAAQALDPALNAATQALQSGLGAATQAAQQAAQGAAGAAKPALPEGALGLGPKPEDPKGVGGAGKGAAAGGGAGAHQAAARLSSQPGASVTGAKATMPAAASSAMGPGMGSPGMGGGGAPGAGGKGASEGKEHKGNKALRTRKNGADIIGDNDAVVPVLGGEQAPTADDEQPAPPSRRIPQRSDTWRPDSAVQNGPRRSQPQQGSAGDQLVEQ